MESVCAPKLSDSQSYDVQVCRGFVGESSVDHGVLASLVA